MTGRRKYDLIGVRLSPTERAALVAIANRRDTTISRVVRAALRPMLSEEVRRMEAENASAPAMEGNA